MNRSIYMFDEAIHDSVPDSCAGFGTLETPRGRLPLIALEVRARISEVTAETTVLQTFRNALDEPLEATYIFPLPDRAAVTRFQMHVAGRTIEGDLKERAAAREDYRRAIEQGHRAALAEEDRSGVFCLHVGNLPPRETAVIELTMVGPLAISDGEATFRFPLVVAPRYTPGIPLDGPSVGAGTASDTDQVPDASRVTPPVLLPGFPNPVRLSVEVQVDVAAVAADERTWVERIQSSLHSVIADTGTPYTIRLKPAERLDRDFILRFPVAAKLVATSLRVNPPEKGKPGVFGLTLLPPATQLRPRPRDIVFVLDRSGSMTGWKIVAARRALGRMIDSLLDQDRFTVLAFDNVIERPSDASNTLFGGSNRERWRVLEWLSRIAARGGTELGLAMEEALRVLAPTSSQDSANQADSFRQAILVIVTDGQVTDEDTILRRLADSAGGRKARVFTVGIDQAVNGAFLRRLADAGSGDCELVESEDRLDQAMARIHRLIGTPVLTDVRIEPINFDLAPNSVTPKCLPDLFADRPITIHGRHLSNDGSVRLRVHAVNVAGQPWCEEVVGRPESPMLLMSTWGRAMVRDLEDEYASGNARDPQRLAQKIVEVSLESHVLSRFTAYVAIDRSQVVNQGGQLESIVQPVEMPAAWELAAEPTRATLARSSLASSVGLLSKQMASPRVLSAPPPDGDDVARGVESVDSCLQEFTDTAFSFTETGSLSDGGRFGENASPVARFVERIFAEAIQLSATEICIEPDTKEVHIRFRINGQLVPRDSAPISIFNAIVSRIFILAKLDLTKRHLAQQGQLMAVVNSKSCMWNVTTSNTAHGIALILAIDTAPPAARPAATKRRKKFWS